MTKYYKVIGKHGKDSYVLGYTSSKQAWLKNSNGWKKEDLEFQDMSPKARLKYLRGEIEAERISYAEVAELQSLTKHISEDDVLLLEWAGVPENN